MARAHVQHGKTSRTTRGISGTLIFGMLATAAVLGLGLLFAFGRDDGQAAASTDLFTVRQGNFDITIPASGELVARQQVEIRNRLESRAVISEIVPEGTTVEEGDLLMRLNDEDIRHRIKDAEDASNRSESDVVAGRATVAIRESSAASELDRALLEVELAEIAMEAWAEGEVVARREELALNLRTAKINFERLEDRYKKSQELFAQQFISADELKRDEIAMIEAEARLRQAERDQRMYEEHTYRQERMIRESDLKQALEELDRVRQRHEAELETARAELASREHQLQSRRERLEDLRQQLEFCTVHAPSGGLVVYASSLETGGGRRGGSMDPPQVGTELARNELVMILPDTSRMVAAVKVNEALSGLIRPGQKARVTSDALPDVVINGTVLNVGVLAESGGWRDPNRRDYTVRILLSGGEELGLRPSMRCRADIFVDRVEDAIHVPVQAIFREGRRAHVYVPAPGARGRYEARSVNLGRASELYVEVIGGVDPGQRVLLRRPQPGEVIGRIAASESEQAGPPMEETPPLLDAPFAPAEDLPGESDAGHVQENAAQNQDRPRGPGEQRRRAGQSPE